MKRKFYPGKLEDEVKETVRVNFNRLNLVEKQVEELYLLATYDPTKLDVVLASIRSARAELMEWLDQKVDTSNPER